MKFDAQWSSASERLLAIFVRSPVGGRAGSWLVVTLMVLALGVTDYFSGIEMSLSIFYLVPILLATGWLGLRPGLVVAVGCTVVRVISDFLDVYPARLPAHTIWNVSAAMIIFVLSVWLLDSLIVLHRQLEGKVEDRTNELRASVAERQRLELEILDVTARERNAFGRELHDELGQHLVATALAAQVLAQTLDDRPGAAEARAIVRWIEEAIGKTRKLARGLLLERIEPERLAQELEELAVNASRGGVQCRVLHPGSRIEADANQCAQLFRIAQEAVGNALRHARPQAVHITLVSDERALCLTIEDDGRGMRMNGTATTGMGLRIMEHRAKMVGASLAVLSTPGEGTRVICQLPQRVPAFV
jgi:signal transduction histidine kinase